MTAADSGEDNEPSVARRRGSSAESKAAEGRAQRALFNDGEDDFEAIRKIIASASRQGGGQAGDGGTAPAVAPQSPITAGPRQREGGPAIPPPRTPDLARTRGRATPVDPPLQAAEASPPPPPSSQRAPTPPRPDPPGIPGSLAGGGGPPPVPPDEVLLHQRGGEGRKPVRRRRVGGLLVVVAILLLLALAGGGAWYGVQNGLIPLGSVGGGADDVPVVTADAGPIKVRPEERGGITIPDQDKQIYERLAGVEGQTPAEERLLPPPEAPLTDPEPDAVPATAEAGLEGRDLSSAGTSATPAESLASALDDEAIAEPPAPTESTDATAMVPVPAGPSAQPGPPTPALERGGTEEPVRQGIESLLPPSVQSPAEPPVETGAPTMTADASAAAPGDDPGDAPADAAPADAIARQIDEAAVAAPVAAESVAVPPPPSAAPAVEDLMPPEAADTAADSDESDSAERPVAPPPAAVQPDPPERQIATLAANATLIQLAAVREPAARGEWRRLQALHPGVLGGLTPRFQEILDRAPLTRIQAGPFANAEAAASACTALKALGQECFVVRR